MEDKKIIVSDKEARLLDIIKQISFGEIKVIIQEGKPVRVEELKKSIKL